MEENRPLTAYLPLNKEVESTNADILKKTNENKGAHIWAKVFRYIQNLKFIKMTLVWESVIESHP